ncbi:hypothetical protein [Parapedobacter sp. 10938]|uniref:hypothetical protein n=1 Tax=Parapedobacter flavus TaxID=3110225 RepID=UPI002DB9FDFA|nr:hypothetical protein [Parapedobacter sp. 10938]MEC3881408.1 hypothetical protein [Parapedobacter sp. 10938]
MTQHSVRYLATLLLVLSATSVLSQQVRSTDPDSATFLWPIPKKTLLFEYPPSLPVDTVAPCYVADFDLAGHTVFTSTEVKPQPCRGLGCEETYLKNLSAVMGLPADALNASTTPDSIIVQFIVLRKGRMTALECTDLNKPGHQDILQAIKRLACVWVPGVTGGRPLHTACKIKIDYSKGQNGEIRSLDALEYRYDNVP